MGTNGKIIRFLQAQLIRKTGWSGVQGKGLGLLFPAPNTHFGKGVREDRAHLFESPWHTLRST